MDEAERDVGRLREMIEAARRVVVFTGAGISTESGIPDFRSPSGIWSQTTPIYFQDFVASEDARREAWRRKFVVDRDIAGAEPNRGHRAVARLVRTGKASSVITQNIDNLHQESGIDADRIIELHGNGSYARCLTCGARHELAPIRAAFEADGKPPACRFCGGHVKAATISFGQAMPESEMDRARAESLACDLMLAVGSSLVVYPAAGFPALAGQGERRQAGDRQPRGDRPRPDRRSGRQPGDQPRARRGGRRQLTGQSPLGIRLHSSPPSRGEESGWRPRAPRPAMAASARRPEISKCGRPGRPRRPGLTGWGTYAIYRGMYAIDRARP